MELTVKTVDLKKIISYSVHYVPELPLVPKWPAVKVRRTKKKVRLSKEALTTTDFVYALSTLTAGHFATSGSSETYCTSF